MTLKELELRISEIEAEIESLQAEGEIITDAWMDSAPGRSGERGGQTTLYRLRWWVNGKKKCRTLKPHEVSATRAAVDRGMRLSQLGKELERSRLELQQGRERVKRLQAELAALGVA